MQRSVIADDSPRAPVAWTASDESWDGHTRPDVLNPRLIEDFGATIADITVIDSKQL